MRTLPGKRKDNQIDVIAFNSAESRAVTLSEILRQEDYVSCLVKYEIVFCYLNNSSTLL